MIWPILEARAENLKKFGSFLRLTYLAAIFCPELVWPHKAIMGVKFLPYVCNQVDMKNVVTFVLKFIYSEKATKFCEIFTFDCMYCSQKLGEDFVKFCGLLRIYELYISPFWKHTVVGDPPKFFDLPWSLWFLFVGSLSFCRHRIFLSNLITESGLI